MNPELERRILPQEFFKSNCLQFEKQRKRLIEKYPPSDKFPTQTPEIPFLYKQHMHKGAIDKDKSLRRVQQQHLESMQPLLHMCQYMFDSLPDKCTEQMDTFMTIVMDLFSLQANTMSAMTQVRLDFANEAIGGKAFVKFMRPKSEAPAFMDECYSTKLKEINKVENRLNRSYKLKWRQKGNYNPNFQNKYEGRDSKNWSNQRGMPHAENSYNTYNRNCSWRPKQLQKKCNLPISPSSTK